MFHTELDMGDINQVEIKEPQRRFKEHEQALQKIVRPDHVAINTEIYELLASGGITLDEARKRHESLLIEVASIDHLTGLDNASAANIKLDQMIDYCQEQKIPLVGLYLDTDGLKQLNNIGHHLGTRAITALAAAIEDETRNTDLQVRLITEQEIQHQSLNGEARGTARLGGDEFFVVLPGATLKDANVIFNRIQINFRTTTDRDLPEYFNSFGRRMSVTGGAAKFDPEIDKDSDGFIKRTERAMQHGKESQKGTLVFSEINHVTRSIGHKPSVQSLGDANSIDAWGGIAS